MEKITKVGLFVNLLLLSILLNSCNIVSPSTEFTDEEWEEATLVATWYEFAPLPSDQTIKRFATDLRLIRNRHKHEFPGVKLPFKHPFSLGRHSITLDDHGLQRLEDTGEYPWHNWDRPYSPETAVQSQHNPRHVRITLDDNYNQFFVCNEFEKLWGVSQCVPNSIGFITGTFPIFIVPDGESYYYVFTNSTHFGNPYLVVKRTPYQLQRIGLMEPKAVTDYFGTLNSYQLRFYNHNIQLTY